MGISVNKSSTKSCQIKFIVQSLPSTAKTHLNPRQPSFKTRIGNTGGDCLPNCLPRWYPSCGNSFLLWCPAFWAIAFESRLSLARKSIWKVKDPEPPGFLLFIIIRADKQDPRNGQSGAKAGIEDRDKDIRRNPRRSERNAQSHHKDHQNI